jgi:hypothetical protein
MGMGHKGTHTALSVLLACLGVTAMAQPERGSVQWYTDRVVKNHPFLGSPVKLSEGVAGGYQREYEGGTVFYDSADPNAASEVHGDVLARYLAVGGPAGSLGFPRTNGLVGANGIGQYNQFEHGSIYWFPLLGAYVVTGPIRDKWLEMDAEKGPLGFPKSDVKVLAGQGQVCHFQYGSIYYHPDHGAHYVCGPVAQRWADSGSETGPYGYPVEDPFTLGDKSYQRFENRYILVDNQSRDFRPEIAKRGIAIRNQRPRATCSIFAMTFLLDYAYAQMLGNGYNDFSEEFLNHAANVATGNTDDGDFFSSAAVGYDNFGAIAESDWPYDPTRTYNFDAASITPQMYARGQSMLQPGLRLRGHFLVPLTKPGVTQEQFDLILSHLARGVPVAVGRDHSMVAVGFAYDQTWEGGGYIIFRNSYGPRADENGYRRESFAEVKRTINDVYVYEQPNRPGWTPPAELAAWWKLDETSGTSVADSSGIHKGLLQGDPIWTTGEVGGAIELDGKDDFVDLGDSSDLPAGKSPRTICAWAKTDTVAGG